LAALKEARTKVEAALAAFQRFQQEKVAPFKEALSKEGIELLRPFVPPALPAEPQAF
jgi:hypothetical protein